MTAHFNRDATVKTRPKTPAAKMNNLIMVNLSRILERMVYIYQFTRKNGLNLSSVKFPVVSNSRAANGALVLLLLQ